MVHWFNYCSRSKQKIFLLHHFPFICDCNEIFVQFIECLKLINEIFKYFSCCTEKLYFLTTFHRLTAISTKRKIKFYPTFERCIEKCIARIIFKIEMCFYRLSFTLDILPLFTMWVWLDIYKYKDQSNMHSYMSV